MSLLHDLLRNELNGAFGEPIDEEPDYDYNDEDEAMSYLEWESGRVEEFTELYREDEPMICGKPLSWWESEATPEDYATAHDTQLLRDPRTGEVKAFDVNNRELGGF